jgi:hypothetical protein
VKAEFGVSFCGKCRALEEIVAGHDGNEPQAAMIFSIRLITPVSHARDHKVTKNLVTRLA